MSSIKKRSFNLDFKLKVVQFAKQHSIGGASREYGVDRKTIRTWKQKESSIVLDLKSKKGKSTMRKRLSGAGRKKVLPELDDILFDWIMAQRMKSLRVSRRAVREEAKKLFPTLNHGADVTFKASVGWLNRFLKRHDLSLRRRTTVAQKDPDQLYTKIVSLVSYASKTTKDRKLTPSCIIAMDETSLWFDMLSNTTIAPVGSKTVQLKSTGNEKAHATVVLAAKGDGTKLKPFAVFKKGIREVAKLQSVSGVVVRSSSNGWMNDALTSDWIKTVYTKFSFQHRLLAWDSYKCHISDMTKASLQGFNTTMVVIPGGCTKYIQAPDVCWNKPFKAHITELYDTWLSGDVDKEYTKGGGNLKASSKRLLLDWVKSAWDSLPVDLIKKSFRSCALTLATDGSEDNEIHCLKEGQPCYPAMEMLKMARLTEQFEELEILADEEEQELNEILIESSDDEDVNVLNVGEDSDGEIE